MLAEPSAALKRVREIVAVRFAPAAAGISLMLPGKAARSGAGKARPPELQSATAMARLRPR